MAKWVPKKQEDKPVAEKDAKAAGNATGVAYEKKDFQMSQLEGIRRGQAFNLAVSAVITKAGTLGAKDEEDFNRILTDKKEIFSLFHFYYELGKLSQTYSMEEIKGIVEC